MFTGLVENTGRLTSLKNMEGGMKLVLQPEIVMEVHIGESVSVNGVCLTVIECGREIAFQVSPETMRSTNIGELRVNDRVNLERALRLSDRLGGHIVTGHVDGVGTIINKRPAGEYTFFTFEAPPPPEILHYTVLKGSIAVDGISLTVTGLDRRSFSVAIIPHTFSATNIGEKGIGDRVNIEAIGEKGIGDRVNIEADIIGKYVEKFLKRRNTDGKLMDLLTAEGFTE
jgi:riboflavin synthase